MNKSKLIALLTGPSLFVMLWAFNPLALEHAPSKVLAVLAWMLVWWITEAVPMAVTSLLPLILFPLLGVMGLEKTCLSYSNRYVFLFLGGFMVALAMQKWNLHKRLALGIISRTGTNANRIILGFFLASYLISMWISNTATTLMMLPIGMSVLTLLVNDSDRHTHKGVKNFSLTLMLSIAYGSSIGGIATLVGSPPNASMAGILNESFHHTVTFWDWMKLGFPFSITLLFLSYFFLVKVIFPNRLGNFELGKELINAEYNELGKWTTAQKRVFVLFISLAVLWMIHDPISGYLKAYGIELTDTALALVIGALLFIIPSHRVRSEPLLQWSDTEKMPWGILLMFGGGMSLADAFNQSGLVAIITQTMQGMDQSNIFIFVVVLCAVGLLLTALMSNIAMVNIFVPIVAALAVGSNISPELFAIPVTIAASCDFMFPMSTPPNAIVYSSGFVKSSDMFKGGIVLNMLSFLLLSMLVYFLV